MEDGYQYQENKNAGAANPTVNGIDKPLVQVTDRMFEALGIMHDGISIYGPEGRLEFCNDSFRRIHGYSDADTRIGVATYDTLGLVDEAIGIIDYKPFSFSQRLQQLQRDGENTVLQYYGDRVYERRQCPTPSGGMVNLIRDITWHHRLEVIQQGRNNTLKLLAQGHPLQDVLTALIENCESLFANMLGSILLTDETGTRLVQGAAPNLPAYFNDAIDGIEIGEGVGCCGTAAFRKQTVIVSDIESHPYWDVYRNLVLDVGLKACWSQPILSTEQKVLGTFAMYYKETRSPTKDELSFISDTANLAGIAIEFYGKETALIAALNNAEDANKAKSEFLATMSHEFRTPLNAILGFSQMLQPKIAGQLNPDNYADYANDIYQSGRHMLSLVNDVLDVAEIEAGGRRIHKQLVDINGILGACVKSLEPMAQQDGVEIVLLVSDSVPSLRADDRSINQIVLNLLSNAIKFTNRGGTITVSVRSSDDDVIITVKDTGIGIATDMMSHLCEPFTRMNDNPHTAKRGTGLGLSIVKALVDTHEGALSFNSELGVGTTVTVSLPLSAGG